MTTPNNTVTNSDSPEENLVPAISEVTPGSPNSDVSFLYKYFPFFYSFINLFITN